MRVPQLTRFQKRIIMLTCLVTLSMVVMYRQQIPFPATSLGKHVWEKIRNYRMSLKDKKRKSNIWYDPDNPQDDRIESQLNYIPDHFKKSSRNDVQLKVKRILRYHGFGGHKFYGGDVVPGKKTFEKCPVTRCEIFSDRNQILEMDAVVFEHDHPPRTWQKFPQSQIWVVFTLESPHHQNSFRVSPNDKMNWTATYRRDSTLAVPYYKFIANGSLPKSTDNTNYAHGKTKRVAMFVSNCRTRNNRMKYAKELSKYIDVDIYGRCGTKKCKNCFDMLRGDYKFYLAFENCNCRHYITEKFFLNALMHDTLPIVMGASPFDYKMAAPPNSFIHVEDFRSPKELAEYLHILDKNDSLYNDYFKWKEIGTIMTSEETGFWCRLCSLLHEQDNRPPSWYTDINEWWRGKDICIGSGYWRDHPGSNTFLKMKPAVIA